MKIALVFFLVIFGKYSQAQEQERSGGGLEFNAAVLQAIKRMPEGGKYATTSQAKQNLAGAVLGEGAKLTTRPEGARPSFCSTATYLVFVAVIEDLAKRGEIHLTPEIVETLAVRSQRDGEGVWGRWNANGPGTPRLFTETGLGRNFTDWKDARPGDFMKIFWTQEIGSRERGHSVVYLGNETVEGVEQVRFWSSNQPDGYGEKVVPKTKIAWAIFSRLERPARVSRLPGLPPMDTFLASMLTRPATRAEVASVCGF